MAAQPDTTLDRSTLHNPSRPWLIAALLLAMAVSLLLLFLPLFTTTGTGTGTAGPESARRSLVDQEGWGVAAVLAVPVLICAAPLLFHGRHRRTATVTATVLLTAAVVVGAASVGLFYLPSTALMVVAAVKARPAR